MMYNDVKPSVKYKSEYSDNCLCYGTGLRQGEILSPIIFICIKDIEVKLQEYITLGMDINDLILWLKQQWMTCTVE